MNFVFNDRFFFAEFISVSVFHFQVILFIILLVMLEFKSRALLYEKIYFLVS